MSPQAPLREAELQAIAAACDAATPGPWEWSASGDKLLAPDDAVLWIEHELLDAGSFDAAFVAGARTWVPQLLAMVRAQQAELTKFRRWA